MTLRTLFILALLAVVVGCQKTDLHDLKDVLYVRRNNADMPAYIYGNGSSQVFLVILHGGPGGSGLEYRIGRYADQLEDRYAVVYWDQRGQGMAQGNYSKAEISIAEIVEDIRALALTLRYKYGEDISLFLLGHSWGGLLGSACLSTADYQDLFNGWIEVSGAHDFPEVYRKSVLGFQSIGGEQLSRGNDRNFWEEVLDRIAQVDTFNINFRDFSYMNLTARTAEERLIARGVIEESDPEAGGNSLINTVFINNRTTVNSTGASTNEELFNKGLLDFSVAEDLHKIQIPSLLLWGKSDLIVPVQLGYQALDLLGSSHKELVILDRSGHSPMVNEPDIFVAKVVEFIETHK